MADLWFNLKCIAELVVMVLFWGFVTIGIPVLLGWGLWQVTT